MQDDDRGGGFGDRNRPLTVADEEAETEASNSTVSVCSSTSYWALWKHRGPGWAGSWGGLELPLNLGGGAGVERKAGYFPGAAGAVL